MRKQETALAEKKMLALIGKPTPDTQYELDSIPAIENLLRHFAMDHKRVYPFYGAVVKAGWFNGTDTAFRSCVRKTKTRMMNEPDAFEPASDDEIIDELHAASDGELAFLKNRLARAQRTLDASKVQKFISEQVIDDFENTAGRIKPGQFTINVTKAPAHSVRKGTFYNILPISDVHYGEVVDGRALNNLNNYNMEISKKRHVELFKRNYEFANIYGCDELHLFFLGDIFSGNIHAELRETNESPITECVLDYYGFIVGLINKYAKLYSRVVISCVVGNHARNTDRYQFKNKGKDSYEYILYGFMKQYYEMPGAPKNITVNLSDSTVMFTTVGSQVWKLEHGDRYKGGGAFVSPFSTVVRDNFKDKGMFNQDGQNFDAVIMGHWHIGGEMSLQGSNIPVYLNPSLIGPGEYSIHNLHSAAPAESFVFITDGSRVVSKGSVNLMDIQK